MIRELLNLNKNERKLFKKHFIRDVIIEIRFSELAREKILSNAEYFKEKFEKLDFIENKTIKQIEFKMSIEDNEPQKKTNAEDIGLIFLNTDEKKQLEIVGNKIVCSDKQYDNFDLFFEKINHIINILNELKIENNKIIYLGFRKINTVISTETNSFKEITDIFNEAIFAPLRTNLIPFDNFYSLKDTLEVQKEGKKCIINTSCIKREDNMHEINLDIDIINSNLADNINIKEELITLNQFENDIFLWSITDYFKKVMNDEV